MDCHQHDYIEIASLYKIPVTLKLRGGEEYQGIIQDWFIDTHRQECLTLQCHDDFITLVLDDLGSMTAKMNNPHFDEIQFK